MKSIGLHELTEARKIYTRSLYWNMLDSAGSQLLLVCYHIMLRNKLGTYEHGIFSTLISLFYVVLMLVNAGLDYSLASFFAFFTEHKKNFQLLFRSYFIPQLLATAACAVLFLAFTRNMISAPLVTYSLAIAFITESIRKTAKVFLQLAFKVEITACLEFLGMLSCLVLVGGAAFMGMPVTLTKVCVIFACQSLVQAVILSITLFMFYRKLPAHSHDNAQEHIDKQFHGRFLRTRFVVFTQQLARQLVTGNALVTCAAFSLGLDQASSLKVITSISYWITLIIQKVFGMSSDALLARTKNMPLDIQHSLFTYLSFYLNQALFAITIFVSINISKIAYFSQGPTTATTGLSGLLVIMLTLSIIESFFVLYEKWLIVQEKSSLVCIFNLVGFLFMIIFMRSIYHYPFLLLFLLLMRLMLLFAISLLTYYKWGLSPSWAVDKRVLIAALLFSLVFYYGI